MTATDSTTGSTAGSTATDSSRSLSDIKRRALAELLARRARAGDTITPAQRAELMPPSYQQEGLWFVCQLNPDVAAVYNVPFALRVRGRLDLTAFARALRRLLERHEGLRTRFAERDGVPMLAIEPPPETVPIPVTDLSGEADPFGRAVELSNAEVRKPFDLTRPPFRASALRLGPDDHVLLVTMHHIATDGWSLGIIVRELMQCYESELDGTKLELAPLTIQPADVAAWQRRRLSGGGLQRQIDYWREALEGLPVLDFPADRPRPAERTYAGSSVVQRISPEVGRALVGLAQRERCSLLGTLLAGFAIVLSKYTGQDDIAVGSILGGRTQPEMEPLVGYFANTIVLRADTSGDPTFRELMARGHERVVAAADNQDIPFSTVVSTVAPERDPGRNPLFQVSLTLQPNDGAENAFQFPGAETLPMPLTSYRSRFDITTTAIQQPDGGFRFLLEYAMELFDEDRMSRFLDHVCRVLTRAVEDPDRRMSSIDILSQQERAELARFNDTVVDLGYDRCLQDLIAPQVARTPEAIAVRCEGRELTFAELDRRANRLARYLVERGVGPGVLVAVFAQRSVELVVALLATVKAGGAYVPLDVDYPRQRLEQLLTDTAATVVLTQASLDDRLPASPSRVFRLDADWPLLESYPDSAPDTTVTPDDIAYVIYTSGSTGAPKGVMVSHRAICNRLLWMQAEYPIDESDVLLQKTPYTFDVSVQEFFLPLFTGARMVLARPEGHRDNAYLVELIRAERVSWVHFVPSMLRPFLHTEGANGLPALRRVICSGEALSGDLRDLYFNVCQGDLINLYGPTEAAVDATNWLCEPGQTESAVPIGAPISNMTCHVLDRFGAPVPIQVTGELYLGGVGVARGYLNRPDLTEQRFVPDPFSDRPGATMYRTGDLVRWRPDGTLDFLGRNDDQVKINGVRIELGEIEQALRQHPAIDDAAVAVRTPPGGGGRFLAAFVVTPDAEEGLAQRLREHLAELLPLSLMPATFTRLERLPINANGTLDRGRLPAVDTAPARGRPPTTETELGLAEIWRELLGDRAVEVDVEQSFFTIGGNSLQALQVTSRIRAAFGVVLGLRQFFTTPALGQLAQLIDELVAEEEAERARIESELAGLSEEELDRLLQAEPR